MTPSPPRHGSRSVAVGWERRGAGPRRGRNVQGSQTTAGASRSPAGRGVQGSRTSQERAARLLLQAPLRNPFTQVLSSSLQSAGNPPPASPPLLLPLIAPQRQDTSPQRAASGCCQQHM